MKKTQFIELFKNINKTKVTFLSIAFFVMLSSTAYLGISWASVGYINSIEKTLNSYNNQDIEVRYPFGLDDEYVDTLSKQDFVDCAEGEYSNYQYFINNNSKIQAKVISLSKNVNVVSVVEGTLPQNNKECAIEKFYADSHDIKLGDVIEFIHDDDGTAYQLKAIIDKNVDGLKEEAKISEDGMAYLTNDKFVITALVDSPDHLAKYETQLGFSTNETPVNVIIYVVKDAFDIDTMPGYTKVAIVNNSLREYNCDSDEYREKNSIIMDKVEEFSEAYINKRNSQILGNRDSIKDQIYEEITNGEKEIADGKKKIEDGEKAIATAKITLANAKTDLEKGQAEVDAGWPQYNASLNEYNSTKNQLTTLQKAYDFTRKTISVFNELNDNKEAFFQRVTDLKNSYDIAATIIDISLPKSYYVVSKMQEFFNLVNANPDEYYHKAGEYVDQYNKFVNQLKEDVNFPSRNDVLEEMDAEIAKLDNEEDKQKLINLKDKINNIYDDLEYYEELPSLILELFGDLKDSPFLLKLTESAIIAKVNSELSSRDIPPLKEIFKTIDGFINASYQTFEDIKPAVTKTFDFLSSILNDLDEVMVQKLKPLLDNAWAELSDANNKLNDAYYKLTTSEAMIKDGWVQYNNGIKTLEENEKAISEAKVTLENGEKEVAEAKSLYKKYVDSTEDIKEYGATVLGRQSTYANIAVVVGRDIINKLKGTMAMLFVVVGVFVSFTSMSRLVHDQIIAIGTKKALGFKQSEVTVAFLLYAFFATIFGSLLGILLSRFIIEPIIVSVIADSFNIHEFVYYFNFGEYLLFTLFELLVTVAAAYLACRGILKQKATQLLAGSQDVLGKQRFYEKTALWNKLSLLTKTIINNCFNDTRRVFATIVGVAGCASLLVCSLSFANNIDDSISRQLNDLANYDTMININKQVENAEIDISKALDELGMEHISVLRKPGILKTEDNAFVGSCLYASMDDLLYEYSPQIDNGESIKPTNGAIVSKSFFEWNNLSIGDELVYVDSLGKEHSFIIEGSSEFYLLNVDIHISGETYEKEFGSPLECNTFLLRRGEASLDDVAKALINYDAYISIEDYEHFVLEGTRSMTSISSIIFAIFIVLSILLALLVILNLLVMFVDEKKKETIVLMINGYKKKFAKRYIYTDTIFLTIIGIIIGSIFGSYVGVSTTKSMNSTSSLFMVEFLPKTYLLATLITVVLCALSSFIALRKIDKYRLIDINTK